MQKYYIGQTSMQSLQEVLRELSPKKVFLVRGGKSYSICGAESVIGKILNEEQIDVVSFTEFSVNPKYNEAERGSQELVASGADCILSVGGGSAMDMAKLIRHFVAEKSRILPLLAVPTTSGTGAEATHFAVVYKEGIKHSVEADDILPDYAFVYPPFTYGNDAYLTACTGFDALAQAFEAYWNRFATEESTQYAMKAISLLLHQLPECVKNPTEHLRDQIAEGAYWAGRAINITRTTAPHAFSYAFTSKCGYPHGHAVALTFPYFSELNLCKKGMCQYFTDYLKSIGLIYKGVGEYDLNAILHEVNLQRLANNPVEVGEKQILELKEYLDKNSNE